MKFIADNPYAFFEYLKICKGGDWLQLLSEINLGGIKNLKSLDYYEIITFKTFICEIIYNAINLFPDIHEYTIRCENPNGISWLTFCIFDETDDNKHPCMGKFKSGVTGLVHELSLLEIKHLYMNNRYSDIDHDVVNMFMVLMYMGGNNIPKVTTSYKINKPSNQLKFK